MRKGICVAGNLLVDKINEIDTYPKEGQLVKINNTSLAVGGCVPNVGIGLKTLCPQIDIYAAGRIGADEEGDFLTSKLSSYNIDVSKVVKGKVKTSFTEVMSVKGGERTFFTYPGANDEFSYEDLDLDNSSFKYLHLGYFLLLKKMDNGDGEKLLKKAREKGITTSIDLVSSDNGDYSKILPCLKYVDNLIINEIEAGNLVNINPTLDNLKIIAKKLKELGVKERVIIHCPSLSVLFSDKFYYLPSYDLEKDYIKGSTGAGDAFCSGCIIGIYKGMTDDEILSLGSSNAVMALSQKDAVSGLKSLEETIRETKIFKRKNICL